MGSGRLVGNRNLGSWPAKSDEWESTNEKGADQEHSASPPKSGCRTIFLPYGGKKNFRRGALFERRGGKNGHPKKTEKKRQKKVGIGTHGDMFL